MTREAADGLCSVSTGSTIVLGAGWSQPSAAHTCCSWETPSCNCAPCPPAYSDNSSACLSMLPSHENWSSLGVPAHGSMLPGSHSASPPAPAGSSSAVSHMCPDVFLGWLPRPRSHSAPKETQGPVLALPCTLLTSLSLSFSPCRKSSLNHGPPRSLPDSTVFKGSQVAVPSHMTCKL
ncbi:Hypothetical predicted protein [Marmota monax]|uniref:Uncharacterized protein n=1 Tax=Marmota monax TaxID=9995 RepID=A0A5E4CYM1_MARMO|nr:hypothetical protein GHT09_011771 [Marmota monax]VTJ86968.1 Hypothetical predicted protein [Marmota monax]